MFGAVKVKTYQSHRKFMLIKNYVTRKKSLHKSQVCPKNEKETNF